MKDFSHTQHAERPDSSFSRRAFLRGSGAAAAATALASSSGALEAAEEQKTKIASGQGTSKIKLIVNGTSREVEVETRATLLDVLRYQLDLTGAKPVSID